MTRVLGNPPDPSYLSPMKTWARFILVFIAYGLALLHTVVPHHHTNRGNGTSVFAHSGCAVAHEKGGLLLRTLSTDLGVGHLETFKKGSDVEVDFSIRPVPEVPMPALFVPPVVSAVPALLSGHVGKLKQRLLLLSVNHFRAPPALL